MKVQSTVRVILLIAVIVSMNACVKTTNLQGEKKFESLDIANTGSGYLRKTQVLTIYASPGSPVVQITSTTKWAYDSKNRVISQILIDTSDNADVFDTTTYTYSAKKNVTTSRGINAIPTTRIDYFNPAGLMDSSVITQVSSRATETYIYYYSYDASGNDTLTKEYNRASNVKTLLGIVRNTYVNDSLSTSASYSSSGVIQSLLNYSGGNNVLETSYAGGAILGTTTNTFYNILSGGFYGYTGNYDLIETSQSSIPVESGGYDYNYKYTFDSKNRVITMVNENSAGLVTNKGVYTYY